MPEQLYDFFQFAEALKADPNPDGYGKDWADTALYDFEKNEDGSYVSPLIRIPLPQEDIERLSDESNWDSMRERVEKAVLIEEGNRPSDQHYLRKKSQLHNPITFPERAKFLAGNKFREFSFTRMGQIGAGMLSRDSRNEFEKEDFMKLYNQLESFYNKGKDNFDNGLITSEEDAKLVQDVGKYLNELKSDNVEEIKVGKQDYIRLKNPIPFYYDEGSKGSQFAPEGIGRGVKRQKEANWLESFMEKKNSELHKLANEESEKFFENNRKNNIRYAALENYLKDRPTGYWEDFSNNTLWADTILEMIPSIAAVGVGAGVAGVSKSPLAGYAATMALLNPMEASAQYQTSYDDVLRNSGDKQLAKNIAEKSTATYLAIMNVTEQFSIGRFMKKIMPPGAQRLTKKALNKNIYRKFLNKDKRFYYTNEVAEQAAREGGQEFVQYLSSVAILNGYKNENLLEDVDWQEAKQSAVGGALFGGLFGTVSTLKTGSKQFDLGGYNKKYEEKNIQSDKPTSEYDGIFENISSKQKQSKPSSSSEPSVKGYINEIVTGGTGINEVKVNRDEIKEDKNKNLQNLIKETEKLGESNKVEKLSSILEKKGKDILPTLSKEELNNLNQELNSGIKFLTESNEDLSNVIDKRKNLAQDFADGKIKINYTTDGNGKVNSGVGNTKISITEKQIINELIKENKEKINKEYNGNPSNKQINNWLNTNLKVVIGKETQVQAEKQIGTSSQIGQSKVSEIAEIEAIEKLFGAGMSVPSSKKQTKSIPKKKESTSAKAVKEQSIEQLKQTTSPVDTFKTGTRYGVLQKGNKKSGKSGKLIEHNKRTNEVKLQFDDGSKINFKTNEVTPIQEDAPKKTDIDKDIKQNIDDVIDKDIKSEVDKMVADDKELARQKDIDKEVDRDFLKQEISRRVEEDVAGTMGDIPRDELEKSIRKELEPKQINPSKAKITANSKMAKIEKIKGVDIIRVGLPAKGGLERIGDIKVAKNKQGKGLASTWVKNLLIRRKTQNRETVDIIAKPGSEGFWEKQGFKVYDYTNEYFGKDADGKQDKLLVGKDELFKKELTDKDGKLKKVDGKTPTPMIFDLRNISLQDLIVNAQLESPIGKKVKDIENKPKKIVEVQNNSVSNIRDVLRGTSKGAINLSDDAAYNKSKKEFNEAYDELKKSSRITLEDFVHSMYRALKKLPKDIREKVRDFLMRWARSKDADIDSKISMSSKTFNIVELMGFGDKQKMRFTRELIDSGTIDKISSSLDSENDINTDDTTREGLDISDISDHNEIADNFTFEGYDFRGDQFFKFLETSDSKGWIDNKQVAKLMQAALTGDKNILLEHLKSKYDFAPQTIQEENLVQSFFVKNQPINRTNGRNKGAWWWANIDYKGNLIRNKKDKKLIPKIGGHPEFGKDIRSNTDLPKTLNMSFVDWSLQQNKYDGDEIKISRIYLKDLVNVWVGKVDKSGSKYYGKPEFSDLTVDKKSLVSIWDNIFANGSNKDKKGNPIIRTVAEIKGGGNSPSFIIAKVPLNIINLSKDDSKIIKYFEKEIARGNLTLKMSEEFLDSVEELNNNGLNKYVMAQHITQHELMKRAHGSKYLMRTTDILHHMKRASLPYGEGIVPLGLGDNTIKIIDQTKVSIVNEDGVKTPMTEYIAGLEGLSRSDGATITDTETLDTIAKAVGRQQLNNGLPMREVKTIMWYNSLNDKFAKNNYPAVEYDGESNWEGEHYLSVKHNEFVADEGYRFVDEKDNLIAYTIREDNKVKIYDADNNPINRLFTLDEAKEPDGGSGSFKLNGRVATDILTLPEESTRVIKVPGQQGKNSAAFPMTWLSKLNNPDFDKVRTEIENKLLDVATANVRAMFDARKNPEIMASLFSQLKANNTSFPNEIDQLIEPQPGQMIEDGYMLPHIASGALEPVKNKLIRENAYKGRRYGFGNYPTIKPDYDGTKVLDSNGIAISEDDVTMTNFIKKKLNLDAGLQGNDLQNAFKDAMLNLKQRNKGIYILIGRQPVYKANGVTLAKVTNIVPSGAGNVIWIHPELAAGPLQADNDGDASIMQIMYFGENFKDESVVNAMLNSKKAFDKRAGFSRVEYFKKGKRDFPATSKKSIYQASAMLGNGLASQGILTNAVNFFEDMHFKEIKMTIGNQTIVTRDPENSEVIMDYAPLNNDITQEMLNDARMGNIVNKEGNEWKSGEKYLITSPLIQLEILLQASVDHAKELLLYDWKYNGYDFIIPKMFVQENGSPIGLKQSRTISRILRKLLSYGNIRYGRDMDTRATKSIASMFADSESMYDLGELNGKERGEVIAELANSRRIRFDRGGKESKLAKSTLPIDEIIFNDKLTSIEKILAIPHKEMLKYKKENPNDMVMGHPWGYSSNQIVNGLAKTQSDLLTIQKKEERFYPESESWKSKKEEANRWVNQAGTEFYRVHARAVVYKKAVENSLNSASYPYADEMLDFINKWYNEGDKKRGIKPFKNLTKEQKAYTTLRFLRGISVQETQILKGVEKQSKAIVKNILATKTKLEEVESEKAKELLTNKLNSLRNKLDKITTKTYIEKQPRVRDIEKILPMQLMDSDVWFTYANLSGPNIREASNEPMPLSIRKDLEQYLTKDC